MFLCFPLEWVCELGLRCVRIKEWGEEQGYSSFKSAFEKLLSASSVLNVDDVKLKRYKGKRKPPP